MKSSINLCLLLRIGGSVILTGLKVLALLLLNFIAVSYAQTTSLGIEPLPLPLMGEYRSVTDGDWNNVATWQEWTGIEWLPASTFPSESSRRTPVVAAWNTSIKTEEGNVHEIALPEGIEAGDLLLVFWTGAQTGGKNVGLLSGFKWIYSNYQGSRNRHAWYKIATGTEGSTINVTAGTGASAHVVYRIAAGTYNGIPVAETAAIGSNSISDPPKLTSGFGAVSTLWIAASHSDGDISTAAPLGYHVPIIANTDNVGSEGARTATAHLITTNASSQDPAAFNLDSDRNWAANTIAIQGASRKAVIQNGHAVTVASNLTVADVDVYGILDINTDRAMTIHEGSALIVRDGGSLRLPGHNIASRDARITGAGSFKLSAGAYLEIGSANGITPTGTSITGANGDRSGNIRVSRIRSFDAGAHYIYNRTGLTTNNQSMGTGYPTNLTGSLTIDNPGTVTIVAADRRINAGASLNLVRGTFATNVGSTHYLTMGGIRDMTPTINRSEGQLTGILQGSGSYTYQVNYIGNSKTTGSELSGAGLRNITVDLANKSQVLALGASMAIPGTLTLQTGVVNTSSHTLTVSNRAINAILGGSSDSFIEGTLVRSIASGANTYNFPLGSAGLYAPVSLDFTRNTANRDLTGSTNHGNHADIVNSSLKDPKVKRHWTFSITGTGLYTYNPTFSWAKADEEDGFDPNSAILARYKGSTWTYPTISGKTVSSVIATGLTELGDFQVGNEDMRPDAGESMIEADRTSGVVANNIDMSTVTVTVYNANGNPVSAGVDVFLKVASGSLGDGGLDPSGSWKTNEDGQVIVNLTSTVANSVGVMAYLGKDETGEWIGGTALNATVDVTFKAGEATHLGFAIQPIVGGASGSALIVQPVIYILDANDNIVVDDSGTEVSVTIFSGDGGSLSGMTSIIADGGVARFYDLALSGRVGETYRLNFASDGLTIAVSDDLVLSSHGSVGQVVLSGLTTDLFSGDSRLLTVTLKDVAGNIVDTGEESSFEVVFSQNGGSGSVSGLTTITGEDGIAIITLIGEKAGQVNVRVSTVYPALVDELSFTITVDKSILHAAIDATIDLVETDWSIDSWTVLQMAIEDAQAVLYDTNSRQSEIRTVLAVLNAAIDNLKLVVPTVIEIEDDLPVLETIYGTSFWDIEGLNYLPLSLIVSLSSGDSEPVEVKWEAGSYNPTVLGVYTILGKLVLPADPVFTNEGDVMAEVKVTVNPKPLTVTADNQTKVYGQADPALTYTLDSELIGSDAFTGALSRTSGEDVGTYFIGQGSLELNDNYELTFVPSSLQITQSEIEGISFEGKTVVYNGSRHELEVRGMSEDASVVYENNGQVNAGSYTVTATIRQPNYEELTMKALLTIQKAQALIAVEERQEHVYDGAVKNIKAHLDHGETDLAYSPQQGYTNAGSYMITISAEETANYLAASKQVTLIIHQGQPADKPVLEGRTVSYDGKIHSLEVKNVPSGANVIYENNGQVDAGTYVVTARIAHPDYGDQMLSATLTIQKAGQRIQFKEVGRLLRDVGHVELDVSSDSGLPVGLHSSDELVATIVGRDLLVHRLGTTRITATQEGDKNHEPADPVMIAVTVEDATGGDPVRIHPALSPNGDGINDFLILEGIKDYPDNKLTILTRNGLRVSTIDNYDNESRVFKGIGNFTSSGGTLPQGTYFYVLEYKDGGIWKVKKGWFVLKM